MCDASHNHHFAAMKNRRPTASNQGLLEKH